MKKIMFFLTLLIASTFMVNAQQDLLLSQEIFSRINKNPAGTGDHETYDAFLHGRLQWLGIDGGPKSTVLNVSRFVKDIHSGFGVSLSYDMMEVGHNTTNFKAVYSHHFEVANDVYLALGLSAGFNLCYFNPASYTLENKTEYEMETFPQDKETEVHPDFDFGFELYQKSWFIGASVTHISNSNITTMMPNRHFYVYASGKLSPNLKCELMPTISYMHRNKTNVLEFGSYATFRKKILSGFFWRPDFASSVNPSTLVFSFGVTANKFKFMYSYDLAVGSNNLLPPNTHEIMLSLSIEKKKKEKKELKKYEFK